MPQGPQSEPISAGESQKIIEIGMKHFLPGSGDYTPIVEYKLGGKGADENKNAIPEMDCSWMVYQVLKKAGHNIPYLWTAQLNSAAAEKYYTPITGNADVRAGDIVVFEGHVGIVQSVAYDGTLRAWTGKFLHNSSEFGQPAVSPFLVDKSRKPSKEYWYGTARRPVTRFLRPLKPRCQSFFWPEVQPLHLLAEVEAGSYFDPLGQRWPSIDGTWVLRKGNDEGLV